MLLPLRNWSLYLFPRHHDAFHQETSIRQLQPTAGTGEEAEVEFRFEGQQGVDSWRKRSEWRSRVFGEFGHL